MLLDSRPHTIVGVAPPGFDFPVGAELWAPLAFPPERAADRRNRSLTVLGKLTPGSSVEAACAELEVQSQRLADQYPDTHAARGATIRDLSSTFLEDTAGSLVAVLQAGAGLVLLVACANLAGLLLARANDRQREVSIRTAIGASRMRIVRQLVTEIVLLSLVSSILALLSARTALEVLRTSIPADMARYIEGWKNVRLDERLVLAIPAFAILIGLAVGLIPALSATRGNFVEGLKDGDRGATGGVRRQRARQSLAIAEIAIALTLLVAAGLTLDGAARMIAAPSGFDSRSLLTLNIPLPEGVRMALGATVRDVLNCSLRQAGLLTLIGLVIGIALAAIAARFMSSALLGVIQLDMTTLTVVTASLAVVSLAAAYVPALRSTQVDPATVLRSQ